LEIVNVINKYILGLIPGNTLFQNVFVIICLTLISFCSFVICFIGDEKGYLSADYVDRSKVDGNETFDVLTLSF